MAKTSIKQRDELIKLREQGMTYQQIANMYGVSRQCIHQLINWDKYLASHQKPEYKAARKEYYQKNKETINRRFREWIKRHPNYMRAYYQRRKESKNNIDKQ